MSDGARCGHLCRADSERREASQPSLVQLAKFEPVVNLKTAKGLGIDIPPGVLAIADEVIE